MSQESTSGPAQPLPRAIERTAAEISFNVAGQRRAYSRVRLPENVVDWMIEGRRAMFDRLEGKESAAFFGAHLPVVVTRNVPGDPATFPFNTGNKGVGLVPRADRLEHYCDLYEATLASVDGRSWEETLGERLGVVRALLDSGDVSDEALASLEIFERGTYRNLCDEPLATLHYTGAGPVYKSFQVNAVVEIVPRGDDPAYRFAFLSRRLFEYDGFHITQTRFPYAYVFHPVGVIDKTPFPRR